MKKRNLVMLLVLLSMFPMSRVYAAGNVRIVSHSMFYDALNALWVVGEVENIGDMPTEFTKITATFYNASNEIVAIEDGYTELDVLLPGRKSPFSILLLESEGSLKVYNYSLSVSWDNFPQGKTEALVFLSNSSTIDGMNHMHVMGFIKNTGTLTSRFTKVVATFYDSSGIVVGVEWDYTEPSDIPPNGTATFDVELIHPQQVMKVASYSLTAESSDYALIPELPTQLIVSFIIITSILWVLIKTYKRLVILKAS